MGRASGKERTLLLVVRKALSSAWSRNTPLCCTNWFCLGVFEKLLFKRLPTIDCPYDSLQELVFCQLSTTGSFQKKKRQKVSTRWKVTSTHGQGLMLPELTSGEEWWAGMKMRADKDPLPTQPYWCLELILPPKSYPRNHFNLEIALRCFNLGVLH